MTERPLLFIDVDGPLNPFRSAPGRRPASYTAHTMLPDSWTAMHGGPDGFQVRPLTVLLDPRHGPKLQALPFEPVWATTWEHEANEWIAPHLGLPPLPVVEWERTHFTDPAGLHWKTRALAGYAAGRPFAWIDDEITPRDTEWAREHYPEHCLLLRIAPELGLRDGDFAELREWAEAHAPVA
ncbi:hypothetical protein J0910_16360 [Nocardiopsis sp. CNT-189]|uniref:hypothetical protein n=1 Tax=Nocardiopsis oceanisediminis TaxID=2816862 RepID=UPI003B30C05F